jgi:hypothetical protein
MWVSYFPIHMIYANSSASWIPTGRPTWRFWRPSTFRWPTRLWWTRRTPRIWRPVDKLERAIKIRDAENFTREASPRAPTIEAVDEKHRNVDVQNRKVR